MVEAQAIEALVGVALFWTVAAVSPGPNFLVVVHEAVRGDDQAARRTVLGVVSATVLWGLAGFVGIQMLFAAAPGLYLAIKLLGGGYLIYLGVRLLMLKSGPTPRSAHPSRQGAWLRGFLTNVSNPKTAAFVASLFAVNLPPDPSPWLGLACVAVMATISLGWYSLVASMLGRPRPQAAYARMRRAIDRTTGAVFIAFGLTFALDR